MKKLLFLSILLISNGLCQAQTWVSQGRINGEHYHDFFGYSVSLNHAGTILAVGAPGHVGNGTAVNRVKIYDWTGSAWVFRNTILTSGFEDQFSYSISLNGHGNKIAVGAPWHMDAENNIIGRVDILEWNDTNWITTGTFFGSSFSGRLGGSVKLDYLGNTVVFSTWEHEVYVYKRDSLGWVQRGNTIEVSNQQALHKCVDISADGNCLAIGASELGANGSGKVAVYQWTGNAWVQLGQKILSIEEGDGTGKLIALNGDGTVLMVGSPDMSEDKTRIFNWNGSDWAMMGLPIAGFNGGYSYGGSMDIDSVGGRIAIKTNPDYDGAITETYEWDGNDWQPLASALVDSMETLSSAVCLSGDGQSLASGSPRDFYGTGEVYLYTFLNNVGLSEVESNLEPTLFPNPTTGKVTISSDGDKKGVEVTVRNVTGQTVLSRSGQSGPVVLDIDGIPGLYFLEIKHKDEISHSTIVKQ